MTVEQNAPIDYLVIGHVCRDITPQGGVPGGTATYSGRMAHALGCRTAVYTSTHPRDDLAAIFPPEMTIANLPAPQSTVFENRYVADARVQTLHSRAAQLTADRLPPAWRTAAIAHLGPVDNEVAFDLIDCFGDGFIGLTPQGWMRRWDEAGRVYAQRFAEAEPLLHRATAVVISREDLLDPAMLTQFRAWAKLLVMTENRLGCTLFEAGEQTAQLPAPAVKLVEPTGAGDIFATAFFVRLWRNGGQAREAAVFANHVAAHSITQTTLDEKVAAWRKDEI